MKQIIIITILNLIACLTAFSSEDTVKYFLDVEVAQDGSLACQKEIESPERVRYFYQIEYDVKNKTKNAYYKSSYGIILRKYSINIDGKVKRIINFDEEQVVQGYTKFEYGGNGNLYSKCEYSVDLSLIGKTEYTYDDRNNRVKIIIYGSDKELQSITKHEYNQSSLKVKTIKYDGSKNIEKLVLYEYREYFGKTKVRRKSEYDKDSKLKSENIYEYDADGNQIRWTRFSEGELRWINLAKYDEKGNQIEFAFYGKDGWLETLTKFEYDTNYNVIKKSEYIGKSGIHSSTQNIEYDRYGNISKITIFKKEKKIYGIMLYKYNDFGDIVEEAFFDENFELKNNERGFAKIKYFYSGKKLIERLYYNKLDLLVRVLPE